MSESLGEDLPTLLILGDGEDLRPAIEEALTRHATFAEAGDQASAVAAVLASAPDVVVLVGDAAEGAEEVLGKLGAHAMTRQVPVVVLLEAGDLAARLRAARSGVAVVERSASADAVAREIAKLARELPVRDSAASGELGEATLGDVLDIVRRELETGILSVHQSGGEGARFVLRQGRHVDKAIRDFVSRIRPLVEEAQPLHFDYDKAGAGFELLDASTEEGDRDVFAGRRVALVEDDAAIADALAQELRAHGAEVVALSSAGTGLSRARHLDPEVVLIEERGLDGPAYQVLRQLRSDPRLRWASLLVIRGDELMPEGRAPRMDRLAGAFAPLVAPDGEITRRAQEEESFDTRLEAVGPSRLLRALIKADQTFLVTVRHPRVTVEISVTQGLIAGADATRAGATSKVGGPVALAALLAIGSGRVKVERRTAPASANVFMPLGAALEAATQESPPIRPSILPAAMPDRPSTPPDKLLSELESVLGKLKQSGIISEELTLSEEAQRLSAAPPKPPSRLPPPPPVRRVPGLLKKAPTEPPTRPMAMPPPATPKPGPASAPPARRRRGKSKTLMGTGAPAPPRSELAHDQQASRALDDSAVKKERDRPTSPPPSVQSMETRKTTEGSVSVAKFPPPPPEPGLVEKDRRKARKTPVAPQPAAEDAPPAVGVPRADSVIPADASGPFGPVGGIDTIDSMGQTPLDPDEIGPNDLTPVPALLPAAAPTLPITDRKKLYVAAAVIGLLLVVALVWALASGDDEVPVANVDPPNAETNNTGQASMAGQPVGADPSGNTGIQEPATDEPATDEPATDEPATDEPADETAVDEPAVDEPAVDEPAVDEPAVDEPAVDEPAVDEPADEAEDGETGPMEGASRGERIAWNLQSGNFHRNRRHYAVARRRYLAVLRMAPRNGRALAGMTRVAIGQGRNEEAVVFARRLVRVNRNNAGNRVLLGDALQAAGDRSGAREQWERALGIHPRHAGARRRLGR